MPSPVGRGWNIEKEGAEQLVVHWMDGQPAPEAILDLLACYCPRKCELPMCACMANGLKCTECADCQTARTRPQSRTMRKESADEVEGELENDYNY